MYCIPFKLALVLYAASSVFYLSYLAGLMGGVRTAGRYTLAMAALAHLAAIGIHHVGNHPPGILSGPSVISLGIFVVVASYLVFTRFVRTLGAGGLVAPLATTVLGTLVVNPAERVPHHLEMIGILTPVHIASSVVGFAFFMAAAVASALRIAADLRLRHNRGMGRLRLPSITTLDRFMFGSLRIGFPFFTLGMVLGVVWAYRGGVEGAVTTPEHLVGIGVWLLYAVVIYLYSTRGWRGRKAAVVIALGFLAVLSMVLTYLLRRLG